MYLVGECRWRVGNTSGHMLSLLLSIGVSGIFGCVHSAGTAQWEVGGATLRHEALLLLVVALPMRKVINKPDGGRRD